MGRRVVTGRQRVITVTNRGTTVVMTGYRVAEIARHAGLRPIFSGASQGWITDASRLGDLLAHCQHRNIAVTVLDDPADHHEADRADHHSNDDQQEQRAADQQEQHLDLFGGVA